MDAVESKNISSHAGISRRLARSYHMFPVQQYYIFPHYLKNGIDFRQRFIEYQRFVLIFSITFV